MFFDFHKLRSNYQLKGTETENSLVPQVDVVSETESKTLRVSSIKSRLQDLGYVATISSEGDLVFKANGRRFLVLLDDDTFYSVVVPGIDVVKEGDEDATKKMNAALAISRESKFVKICIDEGVFCMCYEGFYDSVDDFNLVLGRMIELISKRLLKYYIDVARD